MLGILGKRRSKPRVAINMSPARGPWGGAGWFVSQLESYLQDRGFDVVYSLNGPVDVVIFIDPRMNSAGRHFGADDIEAARCTNPNLRVLHRINECDQRKNSSFMDKALRDANRVADYTVFISEWLYEYHREKWFQDDRPSKVIFNGADPRIFFPLLARERSRDMKWRLVTHHWSPHELKGFPVYAQIDDMIHRGVLPNIELWIIGRWPEGIEWKSARLLPPASGKALADLLRQCDLYITASLWEPGGMHHVEGAQCGLPVLYHEDGGGIADMCRRYGIGFRDNVVDAVQQATSQYQELRQRVLEHIPSGDRMVHDYTDIIQRLCAQQESWK